ncbi:uncharacterized protein LOC111627123 isoform X2 [Centruroides sculpturatus]|uniref:uncharacterized protein LOC111627123 isoform X2 n=1 Tax=Centruroides sculpturatus TaxID=218467 RepID=UPI000C6ED17A|nr:uncharacterized protein LOC111627123 isoform X2 [Centruroides sculpturatus]
MTKSVFLLLFVITVCYAGNSNVFDESINDKQQLGNNSFVKLLNPLDLKPIKLYSDDSGQDNETRFNSIDGEKKDSRIQWSSNDIKKKRNADEARRLENVLYMLGSVPRLLYLLNQLLDSLIE